MKRALILIIVLAAPGSFADTRAVVDRAEIDAVAAYNPLGLQFSASAYRRYTYTGADSSPLWKDLYFQAGGLLAITPAYQRAGVHLEWLPLAILKTRLQFDRYYHAGDNGSLLAFTSRNDDYSDDAIDARAGDEESAYSNRYMLGMTLRARFNSMVLRNVSNMARYEFSGNGPYYLERENDVLLATRDRFFVNQTFLLYEKKGTEDSRTFIGPYYEYLETGNTAIYRKKLGMVYYHDYAKKAGFLENRRWYIQAGSYLHDRYREGEAYFILGIGGDYNF